LGHALVTTLARPANIAVAECPLNPVNMLALAIDAGNLIFPFIIQTPGLFAKDAGPVLGALAAVWHIIRSTLAVRDLASSAIMGVLNIAAHQVCALLARFSCPSQIALALVCFFCSVYANAIVVAVRLRIWIINSKTLGDVTKGSLPIFLAVAGQRLLRTETLVISFDAATIYAAGHFDARITAQPLPSNFADTNVGQFTFTIRATGITDGLCAGKMGVVVVILVLPPCEALDIAI